MESTTGAPAPSPRFLHRSRSGTTTRLCHVSLPEPPTSPFSPNRGRHRSNSASKSRPTTHPSPRRKENRDFPSPRDPRLDAGSNGKTRRTAVVAPSAWALSPGRSTAKEAGAKPGWMKGGRVLGFLRPKRDTSAKEEDEHRLRVMHSRLLQWRFANARAEAAAKSRWSSAEKKLFNAWLRINELRNIVATKRMFIQRRKQKLKLIRVIGPQLCVLNNWELLAKKNAEAVNALTRVLGTACLSIPLTEGAKVDVVSIRRHLCIAMNVMEGIEDLIRAFHDKVEKINALASSLVKTVAKEIEGLEDTTKRGENLVSLETREISLRANLIQATKDEILLTPMNSDDGIDNYHNQARAFPPWNDFSTLLMQVY